LIGREFRKKILANNGLMNLMTRFLFLLMLLPKV
ncbi:MAG: hypothetical protein ACI9CF_002033, partial [Candidatus Omnitrophota bacterium]